MSTDPDCIFCRIAAGDVPSTLVYSDDKVVAFDDVSPVAPVHVLVVPRQHVGALAGVDESAEPLLGRMLIVAERIAAERGVDESGHRLIINQGPDAGQAVDHLHLHLVGGRPLGALG